MPEYIKSDDEVINKDPRTQDTQFRNSSVVKTVEIEGDQIHKKMIVLPSVKRVIEKLNVIETPELRRNLDPINRPVIQEEKVEVKNYQLPAN